MTNETFRRICQMTQIPNSYYYWILNIINITSKLMNIMLDLLLIQSGIEHIYPIVIL